MIYGYARVSTTDQETTMQLDAMQRAGVLYVYQEKCSGVSLRPELQALLSALKKGDKVIVYKIDRFARSLSDLLRILYKIETAGATFQSLTEPIDTSSLAGRMMFQLLGAFAEFERGLIRERSIAGQRAAMERGIKPGRRRVLPPHLENELVSKYQRERPTMKTLADYYGISLSAVKRAIYRVTRPTSSCLA